MRQDPIAEYRYETSNSWSWLAMSERNVSQLSNGEALGFLDWSELVYRFRITRTGLTVYSVEQSGEFSGDRIDPCQQVSDPCQ